VGVKSAYDFTQMPRAWVRKNMTVVGERTWRELLGEPCIQMETVTPSKQSIIFSCQSHCAVPKWQITPGGLAAGGGIGEGWTRAKDDVTCSVSYESAPPLAPNRLLWAGAFLPSMAQF